MPKQPARLLHTPNLFGFGGRNGIVVSAVDHVADPLVRPMTDVVVGDGFADMRIPF